MIKDLNLARRVLYFDNIACIYACDDLPDGIQGTIRKIITYRGNAPLPKIYHIILEIEMKFV